jgi:hypothetical protein
MFFLFHNEPISDTGLGIENNEVVKFVTISLGVTFVAVIMVHFLE